MQSSFDPASIISRIDALTSGARATWFTYLGVLSFVAVTLFGVRDIDFFVRDAGVALPLIGVAVPVTTFVLASAILITTINAYLHVLLDELWAALAEAPATLDDGRSLAVAVSPWLVTNFALHLRSRLRKDEALLAPTSPLALLGTVVAFALLFVAGPALLAWLWFASQPAHEIWLTLSVGLLAVMAGAISVASFSVLVRHMRRATSRRLVAVMMFGATTTVLVVAVSLARTVWDPMGASVTRNPESPGLVGSAAQWFRPAVADLRLARITRLTPDWMPHDEALAAFAGDWCAERNDPEACRHTGFADEALRGAYRRHRERALAVLDKPDLDDRHMDHADFVLAFLPGVWMNRAQLRRADFERAVIEGIKAQRADLTNAVLMRAEAALADFRRATLDGANMGEIVAPGADFVGASLRGAFLGEADLRHALLNIADLSGAYLRDSRLDGASLHRARLVRSDLRGAVLTGAALVETDLSGAWLERTRIGRAAITGVNFTDANLESLLLDHAGSFGFGRTDFTDARLVWVAFRNTDMRQARFSEPEALAHTFGDGSVTLPEGIARPCHWVDEVLGDHAFHAHWRGLTVSTNRRPSWRGMADPDFDDVEPVLPPPSCTFTDIDVESSFGWQKRFHEDAAALLDAEP